MRTNYKLLLIVITALSSTSCSVFNSKRAARKTSGLIQRLSIENIARNCREAPYFVDHHRVESGLFGVPFYVNRLKNCEGFDHLLVISWPLERDELTNSIADLLGVMYVRSYLLNGGPPSSLVLLKKDAFDESPGELMIYANIYELKLTKDNKE